MLFLELTFGIIGATVEPADRELIVGAQWRIKLACCGKLRIALED